VDHELDLLVDGQRDDLEHVGRSAGPEVEDPIGVLVLLDGERMLDGVADVGIVDPCFRAV
jgi:hypothetical protein